MRGIWRWLAILAAVALVVTACGRGGTGAATSRVPPGKAGVN